MLKNFAQNNKKREGALKNEAGGDEKHLFFFFTWPYSCQERRAYWGFLSLFFAAYNIHNIDACQHWYCRDLHQILQRPMFSMVKSKTKRNDKNRTAL